MDERAKRSSEQFAILRELEKKNSSFIPMMNGDPRIYGLVNEELVEVLREVIQKAPFMYPNASGLPGQFKEIIAKFEDGRRGVKYEAQGIIPTTGVASALYLIQSAVLRPGDEVALFSPNHYFFGPADQVEFLGASLRSIETFEEDGWLPRPENLRRVLSTKTRFLMLVNPQNPLGVVYPEKILKEICDIAAEYSIPIVSDEIYGLITYDGVAPSTARFGQDNLILTISGVSKLFFATGLRVGYICSHGGTEKNQAFLNSLKKVASLYGQTSTSIATPVFAAVIEMYRNHMGSVESSVRELKRRRDFAVKAIRSIEGVSIIAPNGTLFTFPKVDLPRDFKNEFELVDALAREEGVGVLPGSMFGEGGMNHIRGVILPEIPVQTEAYERFRRFLKHH